MSATESLLVIIAMRSANAGLYLMSSRSVILCQIGKMTLRPSLSFANKPSRLVFGPMFSFQEGLGEHNDSVPRVHEPPVDGTPQTVPPQQCVIVIPNPNASLLERPHQGINESFVFRGVTHKHVVIRPPPRTCPGGSPSAPDPRRPRWSPRCGLTICSSLRLLVQSPAVLRRPEDRQLHRINVGVLLKRHSALVLKLLEVLFVGHWCSQSGAPPFRSIRFSQDTGLRS